MFAQWYRYLVALAFAAIAAGASNAGTITYSDGTFLNSNWTNSIIADTATGGASTSSALQIISGGNPGEYRRDSFVFKYGAHPPELVRIGDMLSGATFNPTASGAINSISFSLDYNLLQQSGGSPGTNVGLVMLQGSNYYSSQTMQTFFTQGTWTTFSLTGLNASNFTKIAGAGAANPDFSTSGAPIQFGYAITLGAGSGGATTISTLQGIDNFSVPVNYTEVASVPEPSSLALLGVGAFLLGGRVYLKRRKRDSN